MKIIQKFCLVILLTLIPKYTHSDAVSNFINNFPFNISYDTIYSDNAKVCMCGINTQLLRNENYGISIEMYRLVQADFSWIKAERKPIHVTWSTMTLAKNYSSSTIWFGPADASFVTYRMQASKMLGILKNWSEILKEGGISAEVTECIPYATYYSAHFLSIFSQGYIKKKAGFATQDERNAFAKAHHIDGYFDYEERGKYKMSYPVDFTGVDVKPITDLGVGVRDPKGGKLTGTSMKFLPRTNGVVCPIKIDAHGDSKAKNGAIVFLDQGDTKKFYGSTLSKYKFKYANSIEFMADMEKYSGAQKGLSGAVTSVDAFLFGHDAAQTDKLDDPAFIKENVLIPNQFDITLCYAILDPTRVGKFYGVTEEEWYKIFNKYRLQCPVLAMTSGILYSMRVGMKIEYFRYYGMIKRPDDLFNVEKGSSLPGDFPDRYINIGGITFDQNPEFNGNLEKRIKGDEEMVTTIQGDVNEVKDISEGSFSEITPIDFEEVQKEAKQMVPVSEHNDTPKESEKTIVQTYEIEETTTAEEDENVRLCRLRREVIERKYAESTTVPETVTQVYTMVYEMMTHPQKLLCTDLIIFSFAKYYVSLIDPPLEVMKWEVKEVDPKVLEANKQDPNKKVFEIRFYNDYFDDQKEVLLYIPATEIVNEWDKYSLILMDFHSWVAEQQAAMLSLNGLFNAVFAAIESKLVNPYHEWSLSVGPSGPPEKSGSSYAQEFIEVGNLRALPYLFMTIRLSKSLYFYDLIYQSWEVGEKYYMVKVSGSQLSFQVLINKFSTTAKLNEIYSALYSAIEENFLGPNGVVSLKHAKEIVYNTMKDTALEYKFGFQHNLIDLPGEQFEDRDKGHEFMINSEDNVFMYSIDADLVGQTFTVRGFIHNRENIPVINLFFISEMFESEYIVPLVSVTLFKNYMQKVFTECFQHFIMLIKQVRLVENPGTPANEIEEAQKLGQYTTKNLTDKILAMLNTRAMYGCVSSLTPSLTEVNVGADGVPDPSKFEEVEKMQKKYKWEKPNGWDHTGDLIIRRSNRLFKDASSKCEEEENANPIIIHLYPTYLDGLAGYALTVNDIAKDGSKELKTTYHFVKYQDYAHMRVFEDFISKIMDDLFDSTQKDGGNAE